MSSKNPTSDSHQVGPATNAGPAAGQWLDIVAAAAFLFVSRTHVEKLVADGFLGPVSRADDGRVLVLDSAVASYEVRAKQAQKRGLAKMVSASKKLGLYAQEDEAVAHLRREGKSTLTKRK